MTMRIDRVGVSHRYVIRVDGYVVYMGSWRECHLKSKGGGTPMAQQQQGGALLSSSCNIGPVPKNTSQR
jgi:hypothetical protein